MSIFQWKQREKKLFFEVEQKLANFPTFFYIDGR